MWKKMAPLLIVLSVTLNIAFIGTWVGHAAATLRAAQETYEGEVWCPLHRELAVTSEQWQQIEPRLEAFRAEAQAVSAEMNRLRAELIDLIAGPQPDRQAIAAVQDEIRIQQRRMQELVVEHLLAEKEVLTTEQQGELFEMIRRRSGCMGPALMRDDTGELRRKAL